MNNMSYITTWLPKAEAQSLVKKYLADGTYQKGQIKLSAYRWVDLKDHDKGYLARVHVVTGIHPEMELGLCGRRQAKKKEVQLELDFSQKEEQLELDLAS